MEAVLKNEQHLFVSLNVTICGCLDGSIVQTLHIVIEIDDVSDVIPNDQQPRPNVLSNPAFNYTSYPVKPDVFTTSGIVEAHPCVTGSDIVI